MASRRLKPVSTGVVPIPTNLNISALARDAGVSRKTIKRRLEKGWRPPSQAPRAARTPPTPAQAPVRAEPPAPGRKPMAATSAQLRPPLGVVRTVLFLLAVAFYVFIACAAIGR